MDDQHEPGWFDDDDEDDEDFHFGEESEEEDEYMDELQANKPSKRAGHVTVRLGKYIVVFGGYRSNEREVHGLFLVAEEYISHGIVWAYDLETESWKHMFSSKDTPPGTSGACGISSDRHVYMVFGHTANGNTNTIWQLSLTSPTTLSWSKVDTGDSPLPAPRDKFSGWFYDDKLWVFGGYGPPINGYLFEHGEYKADGNSHPLRGWNNQLLTFDLESKEWKDCEALGSRPSPRAAHASTCLRDKMYLFGGRNGETRLDDLYEFHMDSATWTRLLPDNPCKPLGRTWHSFTAVTNTQIVLHGGYSNAREPLGDTWIYDVAAATWREHKAVKVAPRLWHTAVVGSNADVFVFGGCTSDILDTQHITKMTNDLLVIETRPHTLVKLGLRAVYDCRMVKQDWEVLPWHLRRVLESKEAACFDRMRSFLGRPTKMMLGDDFEDDDEEEQEDEARNGKVTCSIC